MAILRRNIWMALAAIALLAASGVAAVAQEGESSPGDGVTQVTSVEPAAEEAMEVLDSPRTASDAIPADVAAALDEDAEFGMNPDLSRRSVANTVQSVYVVPADDHVCAALTVGEGANLNCPETASVAEGRAGPSTVTLEGGAIAVYGIVPDGVESVTVETGAADAQSVEVVDNAYYVAVPEQTPLRTVSYTGPSGEVEFPIYDPSLAFEP